MTQEEFKANLSRAIRENEAKSGLPGTSVSLILDHVSPLFEEIGRLKQAVTDTSSDMAVEVSGWFHKHEKLKKEHEAALAEVERLKAENKEAQVVITAVREACADLEKQKSEMIDEWIRLREKIEKLESEVVTLKTNIRANELIIKVASDNIKNLEADVADLAICENCEAEQKRLPGSGCYPPMYCHLCMNPELKEKTE